MVVLIVPKLIKLDAYERTHPELKERGIIALFPTLFEHDRQAKTKWLESVLVDANSSNGSSVCLAEHITFCVSGDAVIIMKSAEAAEDLEKRSPLYRDGDEIEFHRWTQTMRVRLQYRGAYNQIMELEEQQY